MSDTQHTADELRNIASSDFLPAYASHNTDAIRAMLRAGADAMEKISDEYHVKLFRAAVREQERADKAESRVKELEDALGELFCFVKDERGLFRGEVPKFRNGRIDVDQGSSNMEHNEQIRRVIEQARAALHVKP